MTNDLAQSIRYRRVVSLSHVIDPAIPRWPGDPPVRFRTTARRECAGYFLRRLCLGEHSGTHANAPISFHPDGAAIDQFEPASWVVPAVVIDVSPQAEADRDYRLSEADIDRWEAVHGVLPDGSCVLLHCGWQRRWHDPATYFDLDDDGLPHYPGYSESAARFLLEQRGATGLGTDAPGIDPGTDPAFTINRLALQQPRVVLENLANLDRLPPRGATLVIGVLPLRGGSGSPAAVTALLP